MRYFDSQPQRPHTLKYIKDWSRIFYFTFCPIFFFFSSPSFNSFQFIQHIATFVRMKILILKNQKGVLSATVISCLRPCWLSVSQLFTSRACIHVMPLCFVVLRAKANACICVREERWMRFSMWFYKIRGILFATLSGELCEDPQIFIK